jgi:hypothetical protein
VVKIGYCAVYWPVVNLSGMVKIDKQIDGGCETNRTTYPRPRHPGTCLFRAPDGKNIK